MRLEANNNRVIPLGSNLAAIPERLLLAHARGEVLFIAGAGVSRSSGHPDFRGLVLKTYEQLDGAVYKALTSIPGSACNKFKVEIPELTDQQLAEVKRFILGDYDVVLGMLERRIDGQSPGRSRVRQVIESQLRNPAIKPTAIHSAMMRLSDRGDTTTIVTTNFELLLEVSAKKMRQKVHSYSLGGIPRPGRGEDFSGVLHIHGALDSDPQRTSDLIVSDQDFGEFYLRRRVVPDFIYDAARLFNIVLVGYSANDPPMRYLLNAVAADGTRFDDLKERFTFVGLKRDDPVQLEDWKGRGITPIPYNSAGDHSLLLQSLERWATLSAVNGNPKDLDAEIRRIVTIARSASTDADRDLFDHLFRRSSSNERIRLANVASKHHANHEWLSAIASVSLEKGQEPQR